MVVATMQLGLQGLFACAAAFQVGQGRWCVGDGHRVQLHALMAHSAVISRLLSAIKPYVWSVHTTVFEDNRMDDGATAKDWGRG